MKRILLISALAVGVAGGGGARAGCLGGAVAGGIGGHFVHHPILGAVGGCVVGHHLSAVKKRRMALAGQAQAPQAPLAPNRR